MPKNSASKLTAGQYFLPFYTIFLPFATDTSAQPLESLTDLMYHERLRKRRVADPRKQEWEAGSRSG